MNWEAISAIGEIVGALAVVITLVYLAIQVREQNRESRAAAIDSLSQQWGGLRRHWFSPQIREYLDEIVETTKTATGYESFESTT